MRLMSEKIRPHHLDSKAILYVLQVLSAHPVLHNLESSACICVARSSDGAGLVLASNGREMTISGARRAGCVAAPALSNGGRGPAGQGRCGPRRGEFARFARTARDWQSAHRDVPRRRYCDRSGEGLGGRVRSTTGCFGIEGQPQRVCSRSFCCQRALSARDEMPCAATHCRCPGPAS